MLEFTGKLIVKGETRQVSEKFSVREFVLDDGGEYPQKVQFQATQERCALLDGLSVGDELKAVFNLRGREWSNAQGEVKYFNSLDAWKVEKVGGADKYQTPAAAPTAPADDVPF